MTTRHKVSLTDRRWRLPLILMITLFVAYLDRLNISLALPLMAKEFGWSAQETASRGELLFSLFYVGYGLANILLSPLAGRVGPRVSLTVIVVLWSLFTALGAIFAQFFLVLAASRVLLGLSEGVHFPVMNALTKSWFAPGERSRANGIWIAGLYLAVLISPIMLVPLMQWLGWQAGFLGLAIAGLAVALPLVRIGVFDSPATHPRYPTYAEAVDKIDEGPAPVPVATPNRLRRLCGDRNFNILLIGGILNNIVALGFVSWLPTYLTTTRGVDYGALSYMVSLPYAIALLGVALWAVLGDRFGRRAALAAGGYTLAAVCLFFALTAEDVTVTLALYSLAVFFTAAYPASEFALLQRVVGNETVAADVGLYNGIATMVGGGLGPFVLSGIVSDEVGPGALLLVPALCATMAIVMYFADRTLRY